MANDLINPLQSMITAAAKSPRVTGETDAARRRTDAAGDTLVLLADISSSMAEMAGAKTKYQILTEALAHLGAGEIIAFGSIPQRCNVRSLPEPTGSTALHLALDAAAALRPYLTIVISDGRPDHRDLALAAADNLGGRIDVLYVGRDDDADAIAFMRALARRGGGRVIVRDLVRAAGRVALGRDLASLALPRPQRPPGA